MIDAARLLSDLKRLRRVVDADLREAHATGPALDAVRVEWRGCRFEPYSADVRNLLRRGP